MPAGKFDRIDGVTGVYDGTRYLSLFGPKLYDSIYNKIRYISQSVIAYVFSHN